MGEFVVMGAGVLGLSLAVTLVWRGHRVQMIERDRIGEGSSGGLVGALAPHVPENWNAKKQVQLDSLLMAGGFWARVQATGGMDPGYGRTGRVQPLPDARAVELARARAATARALWGDAAEWVVTEDGGAMAPISGTGMYAYDTLSARMSPRRAGAALAAALVAGGGEIARGDTAPRGIPVIWATGAQGLMDLGADLGCDMGGAVKGQSALLRHDARDAPQVFAEGLHIVPHADGTVAVGSTSERQFDDPAACDEQLEALIARARSLCPCLTDAPVIDRWAGLRPRAPSRAPMLGPWPGRAGQFVLNGGFKIGFGMAPVLARMMADLLEGRDTLPAGFRVQDNLK
jgi:glycine oxidase